MADLHSPIAWLRWIARSVKRLAALVEKLPKDAVTLVWQPTGVWEMDDARAQADKLVAKFKDFGIEGRVREVRPGPVVTTYEFVPAPGIKVSKIAALSDDIAMATRKITTTGTRRVRLMSLKL